MLKCILISASTIFSASGALHGKFGDRVTVEYKHGMVINQGWVIVGESYSGPRIYSQFNPTKTYVTLKDLSGAPSGEKAEVAGISPIPYGWAIVKEMNNELDKTYYSKRFIIQNHSASSSSSSSSSSSAAVTFTGLVEYDPSSMAWPTNKEQK
jgi:hypothetical protein